MYMSIAGGYGKVKRTYERLELPEWEELLLAVKVPKTKRSLGLPYSLFSLEKD